MAEGRGLIGPETEASKKLVRDSIRQLPNGETEWQKVQALVYGPRISEAIPSEGATEFLKQCFRWDVLFLDSGKQGSHFSLARQARCSLLPSGEPGKRPGIVTAMRSNVRALCERAWFSSPPAQDASGQP